MRGERETGITTFQMDAGMGTGPMLLQRKTTVGHDETAGELAERLAALGADVLAETLDRLETLTPRPQDSGAATLAPRLRKEDGLLDWTESATSLAARVRGLNPWPGAVTPAPGGRLLIWRARALEERGEPGVLTGDSGRLAIGTGDGLLLPVEVQPENRRAMTWDEYLRGSRLGPGAAFGAPASRR
jgi:methionyl-tRNA formyltransferase